jgi:FAD dependent oxidoreductase TIGR03364
MKRLIVVGGGVLGTMHALTALDRGWDVIHIEREAGPRGASVRNFGLLWVSGRAPGAELALALRARQLWQAISRSCPATGFRANGSLTIARSDAELKVIEDVVRRPDATERQFTMLEPEEVRRLNPAAAGEMQGALHCAADATVEPRLVLGALRAHCQKSAGYSWLANREVVGFTASGVLDDRGARHQGDRVILCCGAAHGGLLGEILSDAPLRRVRLQMVETEPFVAALTTSIADGDSLRYYPAYAGSTLDAFPPQEGAAARWAAQLLMVQRLHGGLTIGDTHRSDEPFDVDVEEEPTAHLLDRAEAMVGQPLPAVARRWAGVYSQVIPSPGAPIYWRQEIMPGVEVVTGPGGRGMTLSPAIAEESFK